MKSVNRQTPMNIVLRLFKPLFFLLSGIYFGQQSENTPFNTSVCGAAMSGGGGIALGIKKFYILGLIHFSHAILPRALFYDEPHFCVNA